MNNRPTIETSPRLFLDRIGPASAAAMNTLAAQVYERQTDNAGRHRARHLARAAWQALKDGKAGHARDLLDEMEAL